ncbi:uncharacterized protein LOC142098582 [Mixophyes fleayi]|uniref:uncharacterized protein LOC142098582 n=1 Tax=Mixophyes fleayi TaxID=3061075 RepID=UPI003F4DB163
MDLRQLKENIQSFSLDDCPRGNQRYNRVLLQLFGFTGHGKSSLINSCLYALEDDAEFVEHAEVIKSYSVVTVIRKEYRLTNNITMVDNKGYNRMSNFQRAEVFAQLGNFIPLNEKVDWSDNYPDMMRKVKEVDLDPNHTVFIVPVMVYSVKTGLADGEMPEMKIFMENCVTMTGIAPIVVLTHKTSRDRAKIEQQFKVMGVETVISVENYTKENNIKTLRRSTDFLMIVDSAIRAVKFRMERTRNPWREQVERNKFLLEYVHNADKGGGWGN